MSEEKEMVLDFSNLNLELKRKNVRLAFFKNGHLLEDRNGRLYQIEPYWHGSYLDYLISNKVIANFILVPVNQSTLGLEYYSES